MSMWDMIRTVLSGLIALFVIRYQRAWFDRNPCGCGKSRFPFLDRDHNKIWTMWIDLGECAFFTVLNAIGIVAGDHSLMQQFIFVLIGLCTGIAVAKIYYHEKDKIKKAARALGRVRILSSGRLAVVKE